LSPRPFDQRNGWKLYQHPAFRRAFDQLTADVDKLSQMLPYATFVTHPKVKILARVRKLILDDIPADPSSEAFQQGNTLGLQRRHWRRAKFNQRFRLFFRFHSKKKIIVYAWMNDENALRSAGSRKDVYAVFERRLRTGDPPDDWDRLLEDCE
jgi:toxin YhaV